MKESERYLGGLLTLVGAHAGHLLGSATSLFHPSEYPRRKGLVRSRPGNRGSEEKRPAWGRGWEGRTRARRRASYSSRRCQLQLQKWETGGQGRRESKRKTSEKGQTGEGAGRDLVTETEGPRDGREVNRSLRRDPEKHAEAETRLRDNEKHGGREGGRREGTVRDPRQRGAEVGFAVRRGLRGLPGRLAPPSPHPRCSSAAPGTPPGPRVLGPANVGCLPHFGGHSLNARPLRLLSFSRLSGRAS